MLRKTPHKASHAFVRSIALAAITVSLGAQWAAAASPDQGRRSRPSVHGFHRHLYASYPSPQARPAVTLPYGPEYGFLGQVPPNANRMPGYTFVPGVGILGESCDLPSSACSNEYRTVP